MGRQKSNIARTSGNRKLIILSGAPCAGKSTLVRRVLAEKANYYHLAYDSLKWSFSQYVSEKYYKEIHLLMLAMLRTLCEMKFNVVAAALHKESRENLIDVGKEYGYEIVLINLEADYEVLLARFKKRQKAGNKIPGFNKEKFDALYNVYQADKSPDAHTFRTDIQPAEEIASAVLKLL